MNTRRQALSLIGGSLFLAGCQNSTTNPTTQPAITGQSAFDAANAAYQYARAFAEGVIPLLSPADAANAKKIIAGCDAALANWQAAITSGASTATQLEEAFFSLLPSIWAVISQGKGIKLQRVKAGLPVPAGA